MGRPIDTAVGLSQSAVMTKAGIVSALAVVAALGVAAAAIASPSYSVKRGGLWYWSTDITQSVFPIPTSTPGACVSSSSLAQDLGLNRDEKLELEARIAQACPLTRTYAPTPGFHDGTVVLGITCRGLAPSIASPSVNIDLFHRFRCLLNGTKFTRLAAFKSAVAKARANVLAAQDPKPPELLNALEQAYANLGHYTQVGDRFTRHVTLTVTGRRSDSVTK